MREKRRSRRPGGIAAAACLAAGLLLSGCAVGYQAPVRPPVGLLFTQVKAPLTADFGGNPVGPGVRKVSRTNTSYVWDALLTGMSFAWGDAAVQKIAKEGGIEKVSYADYEIMSILGVYATFTVNVYGN